MLENKIILAPKATLVRAVEECLRAYAFQKEHLGSQRKKEVARLRMLLASPCETAQALLLLLDDFCEKIYRPRIWYTFWIGAYPSTLRRFLIATLKNFRLHDQLVQKIKENEEQRQMLIKATAINNQLHVLSMELSTKVRALDKKVVELTEQLEARDEAEMAMNQVSVV